ncbi:MAG: HU family DNA-binding protein [Candidatus Electryoneaceae bacterium]|nr:HU family DNA-binding protein [Candidatus Electryoneaceae bacterium]
MNKAELVRAIAEETGATSKSCDSILNAFTEIVMKAVANGDKVSLVGFGSFHSSKRKARTGVNPATGAKLNIPAKTVPKFAPGKQFKDLLG